MTTDERNEWEDKARKDRERYKVENTVYVGPRLISNDGRRLKKDKTAPKRPMSAFLDYSKYNRSQVISGNAHVKDNKEISKILGKMWREASEEEKQPFIEKELRLRAEYKNQITAWRKKRDGQLLEERMQREIIVQQAIDNGTTHKLVEAAERARTKAESIYERNDGPLQNHPDKYSIQRGSDYRRWGEMGDYSAVNCHSFAKNSQIFPDRKFSRCDIHYTMPCDYNGRDYHSHHQSSTEWHSSQASGYAADLADPFHATSVDSQSRTYSTNQTENMHSYHYFCQEMPPTNFHSPVIGRENVTARQNNYYYHGQWEDYSSFFNGGNELEVVFMG
jgi:hypothetical protein